MNPRPEVPPSVLLSLLILLRHHLQPLVHDSASAPMVGPKGLLETKVLLLELPSDCLTLLASKARAEAVILKPVVSGASGAVTTDPELNVRDGSTT